MNWQDFVAANGRRVPAEHLAHIVGVKPDLVRKFRSSVSCGGCTGAKSFAELFVVWHGREPTDLDWPIPRLFNRSYEWLGPELSLLGTLVGSMSVDEAAKILTKRLRAVTGDGKAKRTRNSVLNHLVHLGLQTGDVIGGITVQDAAREIGSAAAVSQAVYRGDLEFHRVGRRIVIHHGSWAKWKEGRMRPPKGYVPLASIRAKLSIKSDSKLSEYAKQNFIPTAIRCRTYGPYQASSVQGTWYIDRKVARKMVSDRRAGLPMPWFGKPTETNLKATWKRLLQRKHPAHCPSCQKIWGRKGAPATYEDYVVRYPPLEHSAKRHLTKPFNPGLTIAEAAVHAGCTVSTVKAAIKNGVIIPNQGQRAHYLTKSQVSIWKSKDCPTGHNRNSWMSLKTATKRYGFGIMQLREFMADGRLTSTVIENGPERGEIFVNVRQCSELRATMGYSEKEAARRVGLPVGEIRRLLQGLGWRKADVIDIEALTAAAGRRYSEQGYTIAQAAKAVKRPVSWVEEQIRLGTVRVSRAHWDRRRRYLTEPMFKRLQAASNRRKPKASSPELSDAWLYLTNAADDAGVSTATLLNWQIEHGLRRRRAPHGWAYSRQSVRARARRYWATVRRRTRATPPSWLQGTSRGGIG